MQCFVYRSRHKRGTYLFLPEKDNFTQVPPSLQHLFGHAEFSFAFELHVDKKLMQIDAKEVIRNIAEQGFYLQLSSSEQYN